jgi:hypothetical protein
MNLTVVPISNVRPDKQTIDALQKYLNVQNIGNNRDNNNIPNLLINAGHVFTNFYSNLLNKPAALKNYLTEKYGGNLKAIFKDIKIQLSEGVSEEELIAVLKLPQDTIKKIINMATNFINTNSNFSQEEKNNIINSFPQVTNSINNGITYVNVITYYFFAPALCIALGIPIGVFAKLIYNLPPLAFDVAIFIPILVAAQASGDGSVTPFGSSEYNDTIIIDTVFYLSDLTKGLPLKRLYGSIMDAITPSPTIRGGKHKKYRIKKTLRKFLKNKHKKSTKLNKSYKNK